MNGIEPRTAGNLGVISVKLARGDPAGKNQSTRPELFQHSIEAVARYREAAFAAPQLAGIARHRWGDVPCGVNDQRAQLSIAVVAVEAR